MHQRKYENLLGEIEIEFALLWDILSQFKNGIDNAKFDNIYSFQYRLGILLRKIQINYDQLVQKERDLIGKKSKLSYGWFKKSLKNLHSKKHSLNRVKYIGRSLGDIFAYFFYQFDFEHLDHHLRHEEVSNFPTKVGGLGELEFIKNALRFADHFVVYHGITNILRIGDVSLFNLKTLKLSGIGELKTQKKDNKELTVSLVLIGKKERMPFNTLKSKRGSLENLANGLPDQERAKRQIRAMTNSFPKEKSRTEPHFFRDTYHFSDMEMLMRKSKRYKLNFLKVSEGLIYICVKNQKQLLKRVNKDPSFKKDTQDFNQTVKEIVIPNCQYNHLLHGSILYDKDDKPQLGIGVPPLFWSSLNVDTLKSLYFLEASVFTLFNPAHIFNRLEKLGFELKIDKGVIELNRRAKYGVIKTPGTSLKLFFDQITYYGQTEDGIVDLISGFYDKIKNKKVSAPSKIELQTRHLYKTHADRKASR